MKFSEDSNAGRYHLRAYGDGWVQVNDQRIEHGFILSPDLLDLTWPPRTFAELCAEHLSTVFATPAEVILLGTGQQHRLPTAEVYKALTEQPVGFEFMSIDAACRTYNVLHSESRAVVAMLFPH